MAYIYQFDPYTGFIRGRSEATFLGTRIDSSHAVRTSDYAPVTATPIDKTTFLIEKSSAILRAFPSYTDILGEEFEFSPFGVSLSDSTGVKVGTKEIGIDLNGRYVSTSYTLGYSPSEALLLFEVYDEIFLDTASGTVSRKYVPLTDNTFYINAYVNFTGLVPSTSVANGQPFAVGASGTSFRVRFDNVAPGNRHFIGAWYLLFRS